MMASISQACDATGAGISLVSAANEETARLEHPERAGRWLHRVLHRGRFAPGRTDARTQAAFRRARSRLRTTTAVSAIGVDNVAGAAPGGAPSGRAWTSPLRRAVAALCRRQHRSGHAGAGRGRRSTPARATALRGYFEELSRFGIDVSQVPVYETENDEASTRAGLETIFAGAEPPTAILAMSDRIAMHRTRMAARSRTSPFPAMSRSSASTACRTRRFCEPPLTTVAQPIAEMGRRAVKAILEYRRHGADGNAAGRSCREGFIRPLAQPEPDADAVTPHRLSSCRHAARMPNDAWTGGASLRTGLLLPDQPMPDSHSR